MPKISVIVPVYKTEKFLGRCVDSILHFKGGAILELFNERLILSRKRGLGNIICGIGANIHLYATYKSAIYR